MAFPPTGDIALVVLGALVAGFISGLSGTGYALSALGFWLHAMSPLTAAPLVALCSVCGHAQSLPAIWRGMHWPRLWPFLVCGLAGVPIGTMLVQDVPVHPLKIGVGLLLILYCSWSYFVRHPPVVTFGGRAADGVVGFAGGMMGGMASLPGPAPIVWAQLRGWTRDEQRGVNQPFGMAILATALMSAAASGLLDRTFLIWAIVALPVSLIGNRLGLVLYGRVNDGQFRKIVLGFLGVSGVVLVATSVR